MKTIEKINNQLKYTKMGTINNRIDFVYIFDVQDGNPNGDPDAGNLPRIDPETGRGLVTDVCLKRKVRNYVQITKGCAEGYDIFIKEKAILDNLIKDVYKEVSDKKDKSKTDKEAKEKLCKKYYDIRTFGAVLATKEKQGQVRGAIQLTFSRSVEQIEIQTHSITRMAASKDDGTEKTMGRKSTIPYGLYVCHGFISANLAKDTGFDSDDLELFYQSLANMFDCDRSAARGLMSAQKLILFVHDSELGNAPANKLFDRVSIKRNSTDVPRSFSDYSVEINSESLPAGVTIEERF